MHWFLALLGRPAEVRWLLAMLIGRFGVHALLRRFVLLCFLAATSRISSHLEPRRHKAKPGMQNGRNPGETTGIAKTGGALNR